MPEYLSRFGPDARDRENPENISDGRPGREITGSDQQKRRAATRVKRVAAGGLDQPLSSRRSTLLTPNGASLVFSSLASTMKPGPW